MSARRGGSIGRANAKIYAALVGLMGVAAAIPAWNMPNWTTSVSDVRAWTTSAWDMSAWAQYAAPSVWPPPPPFMDGSDGAAAPEFPLRPSPGPQAFSYGRVIPPPPFALAPVYAQAPAARAMTPIADVAAALRLAAAPAPGERRRDNPQWREQAATQAQVAAVYAARGGAPLWLAPEGWTPAAYAALEAVRAAGEDGLDLRPYPAPLLEPGDADSLARQDFALSQAVAAYARQASGARVEPGRISALITARPQVVSAAVALAETVAAGPDAGRRLAAYNPQSAAYRALREKLAELRRSASVAQPRIPAGPRLKVGMSDPRVPLIRQRFGLSPATDAGASPIVYDTQLASLVADFQRENGMKPSGVLTPRTVAALSGDAPDRLEATLIANMEIHRWTPRDLGADRVVVNVPSYTLTVYREGAPAHRARVIVGKPDSPTPIFSDRMRFLIVNPYWNVPESIIENEMRPRLAADPDYLARMGYQVSERRGKLIVRQPPGERNALGRIKFMFPNDHAVYLHDTPSRGKFAASRRAFSHGCVRVDQPFKLAEAVMGPGSGWSEARVKRLIGGKEQTVDLPAPLPIHLQYFTAAVDERGVLSLYDDIYGYAHRVRQALSL